MLNQEVKIVTAKEMEPVRNAIALFKQKFDELNGFSQLLYEYSKSDDYVLAGYLDPLSNTLMPNISKCLRELLPLSTKVLAEAKVARQHP